MSRRNVSVVRLALLSAAAFLLTAPQVLAGVVHTGSQATVRPQPAPAPAVRPVATPVTISVVSVPVQAAPEPASVTLRGPDGQVRRFAVEGGAKALSARVIVLRPGESLTIRVTSNK